MKAWISTLENHATGDDVCREYLVPTLVHGLFSVVRMTCRNGVPNYRAPVRKV
jgi:hypothetical protein